MTFQKGMGSMYDKTMRVVELAKTLAKETDTPVETVERTAKLCKADLATSLVFEFTELQGFIGGDYAKHCGEKMRSLKVLKNTISRLMHLLKSLRELKVNLSV